MGKDVDGIELALEDAVVPRLSRTKVKAGTTFLKKAKHVRHQEARVRSAKSLVWTMRWPVIPAIATLVLGLVLAGASGSEYPDCPTPNACDTESKAALPGSLKTRVRRSSIATLPFEKLVDPGPSYWCLLFLCMTSH